LNKLIERLEKSGVRVARVGEERLRSTVSVVLIGHIVHSDMGDTIDKIDSTGFAEVVDMSLSMPAIEKTSSAYLVINAVGEKELTRGLDILREVANKKDLLLIEPIRMNSVEHENFQDFYHRIWRRGTGYRAFHSIKAGIPGKTGYRPSRCWDIRLKRQ